MNDDERAIQWQEYLQEYNAKLQEAKQHVDSVVNSSTATQEEKNKARSDYTKQLSYYNILQNIYNESVESGTFPDTFDINSDNRGSYSGIYKIAGDDKIYISSLTPCNYEEVCASSEHFSVFWKVYVETGGNIIDLPDYDPEHTTVYPGYGQDPQGFFAGWVYDTTQIFYMWVMTKDNNNFFTTTWQQIDIPSGTHMSMFAGHFYSDTSIPTFTQGQQIWRTSMFGGQALSIVLPDATISTDNPWDYYNDNILPNLTPENAAFPDGYEPTAPPGPSGDPDDGPEEEESPDKNDWGDEPEPHNGFEIPYAFANYAAFNAAGIRNFAEKLWDAPDSFWDALTITNKNNANWLDYFVSLRAYPYVVNSTGVQSNIYVGAGGKFYLGDEGEDVYASVPQHLSYYALSLSVPKYYNNFLDFAPYTKAYVYLPFSGTWEINPKFLYHTHVMIMLTLDITDGSGVWQVYRYADPETPEKGQAGNHYIILEKQCKIGVEIPLSGLNATTMASNIVNASLASQQRLLSTTTQLLGDAASGNVGKFMTDMAQVPLQALTDSANLANANREIPTASGGMSGLAAANACVIPYITLIRPVAENPESFPHTVGHLVNKASKLEDLNGFTTCRNVDVTNVGQATDKEKAQLKKILEGGFYSVAG